MTRAIGIVTTLIGILGASGAIAAAPTAGVTLAFEENQGQFPEDVRFGVRGEGFRLLLSPEDGLVLPRRARRESGDEQNLRMRLVGAASHPELRGEDALPGRVHYLVGDREQWKRDIRSFARVRYADVYPGIDVVYHDRDGRIEYDFVVEPGADPAAIAMRFDGADAVEIADDGSLAVLTGAQAFSISAPVLYQERGGERETVDGSFHQVDGTTVAFGLGDYDASRELVIDPVVLGYASRLGGAGRDELHDMAIDASGAIYVTGSTDAAFIGAAGSPDLTDAYVAKIAPGGASFDYVVYLGGDGVDMGWGIDADAAGNAYVAGSTDSTDFPNVNEYQNALSGGSDAFLTKLDPTGTPLYSTYFGGSDFDGRFDGGLQLHDASGRVYFAGRTNSTDLPFVNAFQPTCVPAACNVPAAFAAGFDTTLSGNASLIYASYVAGSGDNGAFAFGVDASELLYVFGFTGPDNTLVVNGEGFQFETFDVFQRDHFFVVLDPAQAGAAQRVYSTFVGGDDDEDEDGDLHVGSAGIVHLVAGTFSTAATFPEKNAIQSQNGGMEDGYVMKVDTSVAGAASLLWGTFLGGTDDDQADGVAVDSSGNVFAGLASRSLPSPGFPLLSPIASIPEPRTESRRAMLIELSSDGQTRLQATPSPPAKRLAADASDSIFAAGQRSDAGFPLLNALPTGPIGSTEVSVARLDPPANTGLALAVTDSVDPADLNDAFAFRYLVTNNSTAPATDITVSTDFPVGLSPVLTSANCTFPGATSDCDLFEDLPLGGNEPVYLLADGAGMGMFTVNGSTASAQVDPFPADNADSETITLNPGGSPAASLTLADFNAVALAFDIGGFALDTKDGVLATANGSEDEAVNFMVFDGTIPLHVKEILGQGTVAFGLVERSVWTPSASDGNDLFGDDFNSPSDRVYATVNAIGVVELWSARPNHPGFLVASGNVDLAKNKEFAIVLDKVTPLVQVTYDGVVVAEGDPEPTVPLEPNAADVSMIGDDFAITIKGGTEHRGSVTINDLPEPGTSALLAGIALVALLGRMRARR